MLKPMPEVVLIEILTNADKLRRDVQQRSGIILQDKMIEGQPNQGRVYAIGSAIPEHEYNIGDMVVFKLHAPFEGFEFEGTKLIGVEHSEVIAIIKESSNA